jgi:hypothetical protein
MANLSVWHGARINWSLIFEFDIRTMMDWHEYLELVGVSRSVVARG